MDGPPPPERPSRDRRSVPIPLGSWFAARLKTLSRVREQDSEDVPGRIRSRSMPVLAIAQHRADREDSDSSDLKSSDQSGPSNSTSGHAFAVAIAGRYTTKHRPIGLAGLLTLDSTEETPDSESSSRRADNADRASDDDSTSRQQTDRDYLATHTEASESGDLSARGFSRSRANSIVSEDSPRSEEFVRPSEDRYAFAKGYGKPVGLRRMASLPVIPRKKP
jgi:hypothetical protein